MKPTPARPAQTYEAFVSYVAFLGRQHGLGHHPQPAAHGSNQDPGPAHPAEQLPLDPVTPGRHAGPLLVGHAATSKLTDLAEGYTPPVHVTERAQVAAADLAEFASWLADQLRSEAAVSNARVHADLHLLADELPHAAAAFADVLDPVDDTSHAPKPLTRHSPGQPTGQPTGHPPAATPATTHQEDAPNSEPLRGPEHDPHLAHAPQPHPGPSANPHQDRAGPPVNSARPAARVDPEASLEPQRHPATTSATAGALLIALAVLAAALLIYLALAALTGQGSSA